MTIGEDRVRTKFNPSANSDVDKIKQKTAELINLCDEMRKSFKGDNGRLIFLAQDYFEIAAMLAVKAATAS